MLIRTITGSTGAKYELRVGEDGRIYCTCPAWKFTAAKGGMCKHVKAYMAELASGKTAPAQTAADSAPLVETKSVHTTQGKRRRITTKDKPYGS